MDQWQTTKWADIDVEGMDMECKKFSKDIRGLDKEMRTWNSFLGLESAVKNMLTSLRAIGELQNSAIRDRHWEQLVQVKYHKTVICATEQRPRDSAVMLTYDSYILIDACRLCVCGL